MSDLFPKWTNQLPRQIIIGALLAGTAVTAGVTYYFTPKYTRVGYQPIQPVALPQLRDVNAAGKCHRLDGLVADPRILGREIISDPGSHGGASQESANNDIARKIISPLWKNIRHLSL